MAAFLAAIDLLVRLGVAGRLADQTHVVYVSPLKALSNDIERNLAIPLAGIRAELRALGLPDVEIRTFVRTGDTLASERSRMSCRPPHIVVTTPESLYVLLGSESGRAMLKTTRTVIVDEIHALAANKRGAHLSLSLERLAALCPHPVLRIGLSATQKPIESVANLLVGSGPTSATGPKCRIVDLGHRRHRDLAIEVPASPLEAVMSAQVWGEVYDRLAQLVSEHRTTLIFANTRRMVERVTRHLAERVGARHVAAHHGSLAKEHRLDAERRLQRGELKVLVATASLELGIDIGEVDLVCQLSSPRSIATFLQRVGRSGHAIDGTPKGRLFPLSRDDLVECAACSTAPGAASSTGWRSRSIPSTSWPSRSLPRSQAASGASKSSMPCAAVLGRIARSRRPNSMPLWRCSPTALRRGEAGAARFSIAMPSTGCSAVVGAPGSRR